MHFLALWVFLYRAQWENFLLPWIRVFQPPNRKVLRNHMQRTLITLAEISYHLGLIGIDELHERIEVALWLVSDEYNKSDPRAIDAEEVTEDRGPSDAEIISTIKQKADPEDWIEFFFDNKWYFTKSDPDPYPSTLNVLSPTFLLVP